MEASGRLGGNTFIQVRKNGDEYSVGSKNEEKLIHFGYRKIRT